MSWDQNNNANAGDSWGAPAPASGGDSWNANSTPWGGSVDFSNGDAQWNGGSDASWNTGDNQFGSGQGHGATDYGASAGDGYGYGGGNEKPKRTPRPGDWDCPECGVNNFASRQECFKCNAAKPEGVGAPARTPRAGDWDCPDCGVNNFASRSECFKCGAPKPKGVGAPAPARIPRPGDWDCPSCNASNFASRQECFKCNTPRPERAGEPGAPHDPSIEARRNFNWASNRARYEYNENAVGPDGMAPRDEKLEAELFGLDPSEQQTPLDFSKYANIPISVERGQAPPPVATFDQADLHPVMKENIRLAGYQQPTPVQTYSIPIVTAGKDLMACAQTGSGKTAAFLVPTLSGLFGRAKELAQPRPAPFETRSFKAEPLVLIIAPTRELCSQIFDECRKFTYRSMLRPCAIYGGSDARSQLVQLERGCDILAASPGRLMDFIERGKVALNRVRYLVIDEADRMLDMGFEPVIRAIVQKRGLNPDRQTLMYSATFPRAIRKLARDFLRPDYLFLKVGRVGGTTSSITQKIMYVEEQDKREALRTLLNSQPPSRTLIFVETKRSADSLDHYLYERSFPSTSIHGDRTQMEREDALLSFKSGRCPILVATAVAARGIDIRNVMHVVNYDMPESMDEYIHRIGRTARVGKSGLATSFYNDRSAALAPELTKLLKECNQEIPDFLQPYVTEEIVWEEDLPEEDIPAPSYAGQEYVPPERNPPPGAAPAASAGDSWGAAGGDSSWNTGGDGGYGGYGDSKPAREGDWDCPSCGVNNFARRFECFKCNTPKPEGLGGGERRGRPPRRDGDWDCPSCGAVNFARRNDCYKCHTAKEGGASGYGDASYGGDASGSGNWDASSGGWDANAASAGWGQNDSSAAAPSGGDSWGAPAQTAPSGGDGWGQPAQAQAAPSDGDEWGAPAQAQPPPSNDSWGSPAPAQNAPSSGNGWGQPAPSTPTPPPKAPATSTPPAANNNGWGAPASNGPAQPANNGWGATAAAAPAEDKITNDMNSLSVNDSQDDGWGPAPAAPTVDGWGAPPSNPSFGW